MDWRKVGFDPDSVVISSQEQMREFANFLRQLKREFEVVTILDPPPSVRQNGAPVESWFVFKAPSIIFDYIQYLALRKGVGDTNTESSEDENE
jgi:hypothetical protein